MKAITTKYRASTRTMPARIVAWDANSRSTTILARDHSAKSAQCLHRAAAKALALKLGWIGTAYGGYTPAGMVWVITDDEYKLEI